MRLALLVLLVACVTEPPPSREPVRMAKPAKPGDRVAMSDPDTAWHNANPSCKWDFLRDSLGPYKKRHCPGKRDARRP